MYLKTQELINILETHSADLPITYGMLYDLIKEYEQNINDQARNT